MIWIEEEHHINGSISSKLFEIQVSVSNNIWLWGLVTGCCWFSLVVTSCYRLLLVQQHWQLTWRLNRHILLHPFLVLIVLCQLFSSTFSTSSTLNFFYKKRETTAKVGEAPVILRDLIGKSTVSNENEPTSCYQCLYGCYAAALQAGTSAQKCDGPPGKCLVC